MRLVSLYRFSQGLRKSAVTWAVMAISVAGLNPAMGADEYRLGPQDKVRVSVVEWFTGTGELRSPVNGEYTISPSGVLSLPLIGDLPVAGIHAPALAEEISRKLQEKLSFSEKPVTSVEILQFRPFFILGDVERAGEYAYRPGMTALRAISVAGGFYRTGRAEASQAQKEADSAREELRAINEQTIGLLARRARLEAELSGAAKIEFPSELMAQDTEKTAKNVMRLEEIVFEDRRRSYDVGIDVQKKLIALFDRELTASKGQMALLDRHEEATQKQGENIRSLQTRGLATMGREFDIERLIADVGVRRHELSAKLIKIQQDRVKAEEALQQAETRARQEVAADLQRVQAKLDETHQRLRISEHTISRTERLTEHAQGRSYRIVRRALADETESELVASASTPLLPGDILIVELTQAKRNSDGLASLDK
jgi:polysaccharide export outer membrane protein/exopolysaccharide production protein ExoF